MMSNDTVVMIAGLFGGTCFFGLVAVALVVSYLVGYNRGGNQATKDMNEALAQFDQARLQRNAEAIAGYAKGPHSIFGVEQAVDVGGPSAPPGPEALFRHPGDVRNPSNERE